MLKSRQVELVADLSRRHEGEFHQNLLFLKAYNDEVTLYKKTISGYAPLDKVINQIKELDIPIVLQELNHQGGSSLTFASENENIQISGFENHVNIVAFSFEVEWLDKVFEDLNILVQENPEKGSVMMLVSDGGSMYLTELGGVDCPLERGNYSDKIVNQYDNILNDLKSNTPSGRLTVLDGLPGTGKSFFIRGLITEADALFVYIPAAIGGALTGPDIIPVFLRERQKEVPVVLIMEDADATISTRQIDNVSRLSDLLNMSDGLLGDMADIRVIATTNAKKNDIDEAVLRAGRVNEHVTFKSLETQHAIEIFTRLTGINDQNHNGLREVRNVVTKTTLADIYNMARKHGWKPEPNKTRKLRNRSASALRAMLSQRV
jgi:hypothetical protein